MTIKQISLFLENQSGHLNKALSILASENINIKALTIADTADFGIVRLIVSEPERAHEVLKHENYTVSLQEILSIEMSGETGALSTILNLFAAEELSIEYIYAFSYGSKSILVVRTNNSDKAMEIIRNNELKTVSADDLR